MRPWLRITAGLSLLLALPGPARAATTSPGAEGAEGAEGAVRAFYRFHFRHNMQFDGKELARHRSALTPELYQLLRHAWNRPSPKDEPPYIEGDAFTDSQETPTGYRVGVAQRARGGNSVPVTFTWKDHGNVGETKRDTVLVKRIGGRYLIADIRSQDGRSLLSEMRELRRKDGASRKRRR